jgi:hypothetical protein
MSYQQETLQSITHQVENTHLTLAFAVLKRRQNATFSFSDDIIPKMSFSGVKSSFAMPSKHFFRCG